MHVQNWDDHRFVAVLARTGSLPETRRLISADRSAVRRRIRGLEARRRFSLCLKNSTQSKPLAQAQPILAAARRLESAMNPAASPARGETLAGNVAVTTKDPIYMSGVSEMIDAFQERRPARRINLSVTTRRLLRADTFIAIAGTCRLGRGVAMLPKAYTVRMPDLVPPDHLMDAPHAAGLWLLAHPDLRNNPRARAFLDFFGKRLSKEKKHFAG